MVEPDVVMEGVVQSSVHEPLLHAEEHIFVLGGRDGDHVDVHLTEITVLAELQVCHGGAGVSPSRADYVKVIVESFDS